MYIPVFLLVLAVTTGESSSVIENWKSIGCFEAQDWNEFLRHTITLDGKNTLLACALACHRRHYDLFGLRDGSSCRCDDDLRKAVKHQSDKCNTQCTEDPKKKCGTGQFVQINQYSRDAELKWAAWSPWGACSVTCGQNGKQKRTRKCMKVLGSEEEPLNSVLCPGNIDSEDQSCNATEPCFELKWAAWSAWSACSVTCGPNGNQKRTRQCQKIIEDQEPTNATLCPGNIDSEDQSCNATQPCSFLNVTNWSSWSACTKTCNFLGGRQARTRQCQRITGSLIEAANSTDCPILIERRDCNNTQSSCPVFKWKTWSAWSDCSATCGQNGQQKRTRQCGKQAGSKQEIANSTNCAGGLGAEGKACNTNKACCKTKGNCKSNSDCCGGKPCIGRIKCLGSSCPKFEDRKRICYGRSVRQVKR